MIIQGNISNGGISVTAKMDISAFLQITEQIAKLVGNPSSHLANTVDTLGNRMYNLWSDEAQNKLAKSQSYIANLQQNRRYPEGGSYLHYHIEQSQMTENGKESVAMLMEYGFDAFDMKDKILKGRQKVVIPFKHGNPGQKKYQPIPQDLHNLIKEHDLLGGGKSLNHADLIRIAGEQLANRMNPSKTKHFSSYANTSGGFGEGFTAVKVPNNKWTQSLYGMYNKTTDYTWKARKYDRMKANVTKSGKRKETSSYITFRTISKKSPADSWIHPGVLPKMIFHSALGKFTPEVEPSIKAALQRDIESIAAK